MSRWGKFQDVADLPVNAFSESKFTRTYEGGGGGGSQESTSYQTNLPEYAEPYYKEMMARTQAESIKPYQAYTGDRISGFTPEQTAAMQGIYGLQTPGALGEAEKGYAGLAAAGTPTYTAGTFDTAAAQQYMDPYMQAVVNEQKKQIQQDYTRAKAGRAAQAVQAGAFGGGRAGAEEAVAESEMLDRMAQAQATGLQQSFESGRQQFGAEQAMQQQQAQIGQQAQQMQLQVSQAQENLAQTQQAMDTARLNLQKATGAEEQAQAQRQLDQAYQDFVNARDYERQQLAFYNALLRGIPVPVQQETIAYQPGAGLGSQIAGLGIAGLGAYNAMGG
jgi:hypothetical protein